jgi:hypothetical protein
MIFRVGLLWMKPIRPLAAVNFSQLGSKPPGKKEREEPRAPSDNFTIAISLLSWLSWQRSVHPRGWKFDAYLLVKVRWR